MNQEQELTCLGLRVKEIRTQQNLTQTELANHIGKNHPSINKLENRKMNPSYIFLLEVTEGLQVHPKEFFQ